MPRTHPSDLCLRELVEAGEGAGWKRLQKHLAECGRCQDRFASLRRTAPSLIASKLAGILPRRPCPADYDGAFEDRTGAMSRRQRIFFREREEAGGLFDELMRHPAAQRMQVLEGREHFHTWGLLALLLEKSRDETTLDSMGAEGLAELALDLAERLDGDYYTPALLEDMKARAWGYIANARRLRADAGGAEQAFARAYEHLLQGTRDSMERAIFLDLKASLRRVQRRFDEAAMFLRRAIATFVECGDSHRAGRSLVNLATVFEQAGAPEEAVPLLYQAFDLIDGSQESRLLLCARHNLITNLADCGRWMDAQRVYAQTRSLYSRFPDPWVQNRRWWVEGKIARGQGLLCEAEAAFLASRNGFLDAAILFDTALVSLELAALYAEQGRTAELKQLAEEMMTIFSSHGIHREALAALAFFRGAVEQERFSLDLMARIVGYLKSAEHDPALRFEEPA
jgi:tetratricopeptide (TPR) repeat protein